jgi:hypothetical protein
MQKPHTFCLFLASDLGGLGVLAFIFNAFCQEIMTRGTGRRPVIWDRKHGLAARATWFSSSKTSIQNYIPALAILRHSAAQSRHAWAQRRQCSLSCFEHSAAQSSQI